MYVSFLLIIRYMVQILSVFSELCNILRGLPPTFPNFIKYLYIKRWPIENETDWIFLRHIVYWNNAKQVDCYSYILAFFPKTICLQDIQYFSFSMGHPEYVSLESYVFSASSCIIVMAAGSRRNLACCFRVMLYLRLFSYTIL